MYIKIIHISRKLLKGYSHADQEIGKGRLTFGVFGPNFRPIFAKFGWEEGTF